MTREETIDIEQQPSDDCVSRANLISKLEILERRYGSDFYWETRKIVDKLPSVKPQEPRWIPVSERLPKESYAVLVWCPERKNIYCAYLEEGQWWIFGAYFEKVKLEVEAWMPLPPCYEPQK